MDLKAFANTYNERLSNYINENYGEIPRCRGYELMKLSEKYEDDDDGQTDLYNSFVGQDIIYIHTRCGDCGMGYEDEDSNYIYCGAKDWEEKHKDLFITHYTDNFDPTYCDHYFKAVINDDYNDLIKNGATIEEED